MRFMISEDMPGSQVKVKVLRSGKEKGLTVVVGDLAKAQIPEHKILIQNNKFLEGASVADLTPAIRETLSIGDTIRGVVIIDVAANYAATRTGIRPGDVILSINNRTTRDLQEFKKVIANLKGMKISISIYRQGMVMTMTLIL